MANTHTQTTGSADYWRAAAGRLAGYANRCATDGRMVAAEHYSRRADDAVRRADLATLANEEN